MDSSNGSRLRKNHPMCDALGRHKPYDLSGLQTYDLVSRPSRVFHDDLGRPVSATARVADWLAGLPRQLAASDRRRVCDHVCRAKEHGRTIGAAVGGHVIKTGCDPYLIDWIQHGVLKAVALNGAAAIHDFELALAGKTSEDVGRQLPTGQFGMARETADAFAVAARTGSEKDLGLGWALGHPMASLRCAHAASTLAPAASPARLPC